MNVNDYFKKSVLESFTASNGITTDFIITAAITMVLSIVLGLMIYFIYRHYYGGVVYSDSFAVTLVGMTVLTSALTLAISSNVVISLGMVGALSIVRYRTAIKDPMDLLYLFWSISIGIIVAAKLVALAIPVMIVMTLLVHFFYYKRKSGTIYILVVHYQGSENEEKILQQLGRQKYQIKSKTLHKDMVELTVELMSRQGSTVFADHIHDIPGVQDVSLIQYNGQYNG